MDREHVGGSIAFIEHGQTQVIQALGDTLCGITQQGKDRDHSEDAFYLADDAHLLVIADGMGGHRAGHVASRLAAETVVELVEAWQQEREPCDSAEAVLVRAFDEAQRRVLEFGDWNPEYAGMGTTLTACLRDEGRFTVCHIGDSRLYRVEQRSGIERVTRDHTLVEVLVETGHLSEEEARVHERRNQILKAIGSESKQEADIYFTELVAGDGILLCTDGLWGVLADSELQEIVCTEGSARERAEGLVMRAHHNQGNDDVTVILYEHND